MNLTTNEYKNEIFNEIEDLSRKELERVLQLIKLEKWRNVKLANPEKGFRMPSAKALEKIKHKLRKENAGK
ncbi:MAG: hypothetical protein JST43_00245 [Bacteroidetes bacterium]|nr:hypothetical protein [Bacteroidota bacterium]MBS1540822.1 hypothetical protein [Bacteroidota bacterium]